MTRTYSPAEIKQNRRAVAKWIGLGVAGLLVLFVAAGLAGLWDRPAQIAQPPSAVAPQLPDDAWKQAVMDIANVRSAEVDGATLRVYVDVPEQLSDPYYTSALTRAGLAIGKGMKAGEIKLPASIHSIELAGFVGLVDKYANKSSGEFLQLTFPVSEVAKVNFENMSEYNFINLADVGVPTSVGHKLVNAYCADEQTGDWSREFCSKARAQ